MTSRDAVRDALFQHSDVRPCRLVWEALDESRPTPEDLEVRDYVEVARVTDGTVCLVASETHADLYVRWDRSAGQFVHAAFCPPGSVVDAGTATDSEVVSLLEKRDGPSAVHFSETPFANDGPAADISPLF